MRKRSNKDLCPRYPGRQWKQMFTFKGNKFDMQGITHPSAHVQQFDFFISDGTLFKVDICGRNPFPSSL